MKVVAIANLRWVVFTPSWYQLAREGTQVDMIYNGTHWYITNGNITAQVPDRDTGAMMLAKALNRAEAERGQ